MRVVPVGRVACGKEQGGSETKHTTRSQCTRGVLWAGLSGVGCGVTCVAHERVRPGLAQLLPLVTVRLCLLSVAVIVLLPIAVAP